MGDPPTDVTQLLEAIVAGDREARPRLFEAVYSELHALAHSAMRSEQPGRTLQTTALVHEAYLRMVRERAADWHNRAHFFGAAASAMRRILVDEARRRRAAKRGGGAARVSLSGLPPDDRAGEPEDRAFADVEALDSALERLGGERAHERKCQVVELRFFVGLSLEQSAEVLGVSIATIKRDWEFARAWLRREMKKVSGDERRSAAD